MRGLSLVAASGGHSSSRCAGLSLSRPLLLRSTGSRRAGSVIVAHGPSCSAACGIFPDQGSNPCSLHWQEDSQPLCRQGSPNQTLLKKRPYVSQAWGTYFKTPFKGYIWKSLTNPAGLAAALLSLCRVLSFTLLQNIVFLMYLSFSESKFLMSSETGTVPGI